MDYKFIILAIVGIIIAYLIYSYVFSTPGITLMGSTFYLGVTPNAVPTPITFNTLGSNTYTSQTLSFYAWVYVNSPPSNNLDTPLPNSFTIAGNHGKTLFYLNNIEGSKDTPRSSNNIFYAWALDSTGQNLYVIYNTTTITTASNSAANYQSIKALSNIPIQKWSFITVVLDNTNIITPIMDVYMNGKLVNSLVLDSTNVYNPPKPPSGMKSSSVTSAATGGMIKPSPTTSAIQFGYQQDVYIADLTAFNSPFGPDAVQKAYLSFSGSQNNAVNGKIHYGISVTKGSGRNMLSNEFQIW